MCHSFGERGRRVEIAVSLLIVLWVSFITISCCLDREMVEKLFQWSQMLSPKGIKVAEVEIRMKGRVVYSQRRIKVKGH